jgi:hypothetical protein
VCVRFRLLVCEKGETENRDLIVEDRLVIREVGEDSSEVAEQVFPAILVRESYAILASGTTSTRRGRQMRLGMQLTSRSIVGPVHYLVLG